MLAQKFHMSIADPHAPHSNACSFHIAGTARLWLLERRTPYAVRFQVIASESQLHDTLLREGEHVSSCSAVQQRGSIDNDLVVCRVSHVWHKHGCDFGRLVFEGDFPQKVDLIPHHHQLIWRDRRNDHWSTSPSFEKTREHRAMEVTSHERFLILRRRFPYMFDSVSASSLDLFEGWLPAFVQACAAIDQLLGLDKRQFRWVYAGEELGGARYAFELDGIKIEICEDLRQPDASGQPQTHDPTLDAICALVRDAMAGSEETCMLCGRPGRLSGLFGAVMCLCDVHRRFEIASNVWELSRLQEADNL